MAGKPREQGLLVQRSTPAIDHLAPLQHQEGGNPIDIEPPRQMRVFIGIDLNHCSFAGKFPGNLLHHRCKVPAVRSPRRPKFRQHRAGIRADETVKAPVGKKYGVDIKRREGTVTAATAAGFFLVDSRHPVTRATGGAPYQICLSICGHSGLTRAHQGKVRHLPLQNSIQNCANSYSPGRDNVSSPVPDGLTTSVSPGSDFTTLLSPSTL